jgi:hypothetical protein
MGNPTLHFRSLITHVSEALWLGITLLLGVSVLAEDLPRPQAPFKGVIGETMVALSLPITES